MAVGTGTGVTLTGGTSGAEINVIDVNYSGRSRTAIDITTNDTASGGTAGREFVVSSLYDPGSITVTAKLDFLLAANLPPSTGVAETWTIASQGASFAASGFITDESYNWPHEDANTVTFTIKLTGDVTYTPPI